LLYKYSIHIGERLLPVEHLWQNAIYRKGVVFLVKCRRYLWSSTRQLSQGYTRAQGRGAN